MYLQKPNMDQISPARRYEKVSLCKRVFSSFAIIALKFSEFTMAMKVNSTPGLVVSDQIFCETIYDWL